MTHDEKDVYDAGFEVGMKAVVQQIDGIIYESIDADDAVKAITRWIEDFWKERES